MIKICKKISRKTGKEYVGMFAVVSGGEYLITCDKLVLCELVGCAPSVLNRLEKDIIFRK